MSNEYNPSRSRPYAPGWHPLIARCSLLIAGGLMQIAFIGLGAMGTPMARTLLTAGFALSGYDADPARSAALVPEGGTAAGSAAEAAASADVLLVMVQNYAQVADALLGSGAALAALPPGAVVLVMSTI